MVALTPRACGRLKLSKITRKEGKERGAAPNTPKYGFRSAVVYELRSQPKNL